MKIILKVLESGIKLCKLCVYKYKAGFPWNTDCSCVMYIINFLHIATLYRLFIKDYVAEPNINFSQRQWRDKVVAKL